MATGFTNAREFRLGLKGVGDQVARDVQTVQRAISISAIPKLVLKTPVATGEARGGWQFSVDTVPGSSPSRIDAAGGQTIATETARTASVGRFKRTFITNGVAHIETLENGGYRPPNPSTDPEALEARASRRDASTRRRAKQAGGHEGSPLIAEGFSLQAPEGMVAVTFEELRQEFRLT